MVNVKKSITVLKHFVLILTLMASGNYCNAQLTVTKIEAKQINVNEKAATPEKYETFISPYRQRIDKDMDNILATCPETLDRSKGQWQSNIGDMMANATLSKTSPVFRKREGRDIDVCILNHGGIRSILPAGNVTTRNAFEIMPFENTTVVVELKGAKIAEFVKYFIKEKKPHPIAGITFTIDLNNEGQDIRIKDQPLNLEKSYFVVTSDYLANGGDNMNFFKDPIRVVDLDYKLRNILIDYFKDVKTIPVVQQIKVTQEK
ncbi:5'-nucleotidase [Flavobacterium sp.]|uniref:5'-nucleotidase C-terminal domain-containing protein n=1 Tax=Flavobacterium sp. TaxID=239 RepID=UPI002612BB12|nr:5'-nucleotidase [Flavobacterium sp.]